MKAEPIFENTPPTPLPTAPTPLPTPLATPYPTTATPPTIPAPTAPIPDAILLPTPPPELFYIPSLNGERHAFILKLLLLLLDLFSIIDPLSKLISILSEEHNSEQ